jgi:hypothetical protein
MKHFTLYHLLSFLISLFKKQSRTALIILERFSFNGCPHQPIIGSRSPVVRELNIIKSHYDRATMPKYFNNNNNNNNNNNTELFFIYRVFAERLNRLSLSFAVGLYN